MNELKKTALHSWHLKNGAKMAPFAGWEMPLQYENEMKEYQAVHETVGLFDISHMAVIETFGPDAEKFVDLVTTNDAGRLPCGGAQYTLICNEDGGILEDPTVYKCTPTNFFFIVNACNVEKISMWFHKTKDARNFNLRIKVSERHGLFTLQGPLSENILSELVSQNEVPYVHGSFISTLIEGFRVIISRTVYLGDGFEILCNDLSLEALWESFLDVGKTFGCIPCGLTARDTLRTEAGMLRYGNEIDKRTNPIEVGLEKFVSLEKNDFIGKSAIEKAILLKNRGSGKYVHGFAVDEKFFPEQGCAIFADSLVPDEIGVLTSVTYSPRLKKRIALGYLSGKYSPKDIVWVQIGQEYRPAEVAEVPFYNREK